MDLKIGTLLKEIRNHSQPLKLPKKIVTNVHNREASRKLHKQLEIPSCLGYRPKKLYRIRLRYTG